MANTEYLKSKFKNGMIPNENDYNDLIEYGGETRNAIISIENANANDDINLINYLGNKENIHPKVISFDKSWNGYKYWMAYTPYPLGKTDNENPCIAVSNDKVNWESPAENLNPLDPTPPAGWNSDTHLLHRTDIDQMEIWWREYDPAKKEAKIWRRVTSDGKSWENKELMFNPTNTPYDDLLSPAILFEDGMYKIWYISGGGDKQIYYQQTNDSNTTSWTDREIINIDWGILTPWHMDVISTDLGYEFITTCWEPGGNNNTADLYYHVTYNDGSNSKPIKILAKSEDITSIDHSAIYRSSILKENGKYFIFYSSIAKDTSRHMSLSYGESIYGLTGYKNHDLYRKQGNRVAEIEAGSTLKEFNTENIDTLMIKGGEEVVIEKLINGYAGKKISVVLVSSTSKLRIKSNLYMLNPSNEDIILRGVDGYVLEFICSTDHGFYWRPIYNRPAPPKVLSLDTPQVIENFDVSNIETLILFSTGTTDRFTVKSFTGAKAGQVLHLVTNGTPFVDVLNSSLIRLPGGQNIELNQKNPGITLVFASGSNAKGF